MKYKSMYTYFYLFSHVWSDFEDAAHIMQSVAWHVEGF